MIVFSNSAWIKRFDVFLAIIVSLSTTASAFGPYLQQPFVNVRQSAAISYPSSSRHQSRLFFGLSSIEKQEEKYLELAAGNPGTSVPESVSIVAYNPGTDQETVHTTEYPRGSGNYCLLVFESPVECEHFADMIEVGVPGAVDATPTFYTLQQMTNYCQEMNLPLQLVPEF